MYSPTLGRFMQRDPAGYVDGVNLYAYVMNNPLVNLDPDGLMVRAGVSACHEALLGSANLINETVVFPVLDLLALPSKSLDYLGQNVDFIGETIGRSSEERQAIAASVFGQIGPDDAVLGVIGALDKLPEITRRVDAASKRLPNEHGFIREFVQE